MLIDVFLISDKTKLSMHRMTPDILHIPNGRHLVQQFEPECQDGAEAS